MNEILKRILDVVLSTQFIATVSGSTLTLLGVYFTLRQSQRVHERNLEHENQKRRDQRTFDAKKQAFIEAVEAIGQFVQYLMRLPDIPTAPVGENDPSITNLSIKVNNLHLYASNETIECSIQLSSILTISYIEVLKHKMPVSFLTEDLKTISNRISTFHSWIESLEKIKGQESLIAQHWKSVADLEAQKSKVILERYNAIELCRDQLIKSLPAIHQAQMPALILIRKELGFEFDSERYENLMRKTGEEALSYLKEAVTHARKEVAKKITQ